jgi:hypothetical protein
LGWIADRWSRKGVLEIGAVNLFQRADRTLCALAGMDVSGCYTGCPGEHCFLDISMAITLQFGSEDERPTYVGMANTLIAPATIIAPAARRLAGRCYRLPVYFSYWQPSLVC